MKKVTIVGRGTVGVLAVLHFKKNTDWEIDWVYDPAIQPASVGEGSNLFFPKILQQNMQIDNVDMDNIYATPKLGIWKRGWGVGTDFKHAFPVGQHGVHFSAVEFQKYMFDILTKDKRITVIEKNIQDYENVDSDYVMVCAGVQKASLDEYTVRDKIPVNTATIFQCPWDIPQFNYSLTFARKFGWVFGIPLQNRCSIGYVYNRNLNNENEVINDVQEILAEFKLTPSSTRTLQFSNYSRKNNYSRKVVYNGNASFFLEPLEATSIGFAAKIIENAHTMWLGYQTPQEAQRMYDDLLDELESMICLHYFSGSVYDTPFWKHAERLGNLKMLDNVKKNNQFVRILKEAVKHENLYFNIPFTPEVGTWPLRSYVQNIIGLGVKAKLQKIING